MSTRPIAAERSNESPVVRKPLSLLKNILAANIVGRHFFCSSGWRKRRPLKAVLRFLRIFDGLFAHPRQRFDAYLTASGETGFTGTEGSVSSITPYALSNNVKADISGITADVVLGNKFLQIKD